MRTAELKDMLHTAPGAVSHEDDGGYSSLASGNLVLGYVLNLEHVCVATLCNFNA